MPRLTRVRLLQAFLVVACLTRSVFGLDPSRNMSQYIFRRWGTESEFPSGPVHAITQTPDGYLWIGTDKGLVRFDGFDFRSFPLAPNIGDPNTPVLGLTTDQNGDLLIQPQGLGMLRRVAGQFETVDTGLVASASQVTAMFREKDGGVLFADLIAGTLRLRDGKVQQIMTDTVAGAAPVMALTELPNGAIWIGTLHSGALSVYGGKVSQVGSELLRTKVNCLLPAGGDEVWLGTDDGIFRWDGKKFIHLALPTRSHEIQILSLLQDRDSNVWVGTARGLWCIKDKEISRWDDGQYPIGAVNALFEDREGNVWVGATRGLVRVRDSSFLTYSSATGLPSDQTGPVYIDRQGLTWFAPIEGGIYFLSGSKAQPIRVPGLQAEVIYSIAGGSDGSIWLGRQRGGITRLHLTEEAPTLQTYTEKEGLTQNSVYSVYQARDGTLWAGTLSGGVSKFKDGKFVTYTSANGLGANTIAAILESRDGTMWFGTPNGLSAFTGGRWQTYTKADGLPSADVNCLYEDSSGVLWIGTSGGLASLKNGHIYAPQSIPSSLHEEIFGIAQDHNRALWIATARHVLQVQSERLSNDTLEPADVREFWVTDGLLGVGGVKRNQSVQADPSGKIWFSLNRGLSVVDPAHINVASVPTLAHVESLTADGKTIDISGNARIPPSPRRVTFNFTGVSLAAPEHVQFRYMLENFDRRWSDPVGSREAVYTNLGPGDYRFRVAASNSAGVWNGVETALAFDVQPALWQTWWLRLLSLLALGSLALFIYQYRLHKVTSRLNARFEERLAERTRIAQELHDTLLQGVLSASMQLHVANDRLENESAAKPLLERVLQLMGRVADDGRNAIRGLRLTKENPQDLDRAFSRVPQELTIQTQADFRVVVEGAPRALHPVIRDEVYRIGREALANALRHSGAKTIQVELEYGSHDFRLLIQDDGVGIDPKVLRAGRDGHWGLSGMHERSEKIGAKLKVWSKLGDGTEVDLRVPARIAFTSNSSAGLGSWISKISARRSGNRPDANPIGKS